MKKRLVKFLILSVFIGFGVLFVGYNTISGNKLTADQYQDLVSKTYDFRFGADKPFFPSNATTFNGKFLSAENFVTAARCGKCHTDTHPQWRESAHANSFREPFYQKNVNDLIAQKNIAFTRHCESCHNPTALFTGVLTDKPPFKKRPFDEDGVSCIVCHSIESVSGRGIGGYVLGQPALLQKADGTKILEATDQDIINDVPSHKRAMMRDLMKKPDFCAACHKSQVPRELNDYKFMRAFAVGDEMQMSSFSKESPHPFYVRNKETCNTCHIKQVPTKYFDVSARTKGTIASHRFATANTAIPTFYKNHEQLNEVVKFLQDDKMGIDIFAIRRKAQGSKKDELIAPLNRKNFTLGSGDSITADVVITNKNIGHSFPPELRDFYEAYIEFTVTDSNDKTLFKSGFIKPNGQLEEKSHNYKTWLVFKNGKLNDLHYIWDTKVVAHNLQIQSGRSDVARYKFNIPNNLSGKLKLTAKLKYRRFNRSFSDYVLKKSVDYPIVTMATSENVLLIGENKEKFVDQKVSPDWKRWNNYGIALFDHRQFPQAAEAFDEVISANNEYRAFANTNKALALMELNGWQEAEKLINKSLEIDEKNMRAVFQRGRINRVRSRLDKAESDFKKVLESYPRDRLTLQQLGELAKIKSDTVSGKDRKNQLNIAQGYYEQILEIDPEDLGSHYNLMIIYQKLGMREDAKKEAKIFQDLKEDPVQTPLASSFLQNNPSIGNESFPYHSHELKLFQSVWEKTDYLGMLK